MHLVDDQDDVALLADLLDEALHAAFKLAPELGARHESGQVQQIDLLVLQLIGDAAHGDSLGQTLGNGGLANAGLADEAGIVLLAAVQDLDHTLQLLLPAHHGIQLPLGGPLGQVDAVIVQELVLEGPGRLARLVLGTGGLFLPGRGIVLGAGAAEEAVQEGEGGGLAVVVALVLRAGIVQVHQLLRAVEGGGHLPCQALQILIGETHAVDDIVHGLDVQLPGALETEALVLGLAVFQLGDEDHGDVFVAAGAESGVHSHSSLGV